MKTNKLFSWIGIIVILISGLIHLYNASDEYRDARHMGIAFFTFFLGSIVSAIGIDRDEYLLGWSLGSLLCIVAIIGYLISRTVAMPSKGVEDWGPPLSSFFFPGTRLLLSISHIQNCLNKKVTLISSKTYF